MKKVKKEGSEKGRKKDRRTREEEEGEERTKERKKERKKKNETTKTCIRPSSPRCQTSQLLGKLELRCAWVDIETCKGAVFIPL